MPSKTITKVIFPPKAAPESATAIELRIAAYARVSSIKDAQENSLESQKDYFERYIKGHPGWQFAGIFVDDGISGLSYHRREGFNRMVQDALNVKIDRIITKSLSRFARNTVDALTTIRKLKAVGVAVYFQKENIDTLDTKGEFLLTLMSSFAEEESRSTLPAFWTDRGSLLQAEQHHGLVQLCTVFCETRSTRGIHPSAVPQFHDVLLLIDVALYDA